MKKKACDCETFHRTLGAQFLTRGSKSVERRHGQNSINPKGNSEMEKKKAMQIEGYPIEGLSIGGHETCIIFPSLRIAFDIGRCPHRAISQDFLFISHSHMDHIVRIIFLNLPLKDLNFPIRFCKDCSLTIFFFLF